MCYLNTSRKMSGSTDVLFRPMQAFEDLALIYRKSRQNLRALAAHAHKTDRRLGVALDDVLEEDVNGIALRLEPGWCVVAVPAALAVVHHDHDRLEHHVGQLGWGVV